jgi:anti-anti-sigma factor
MSGDNEVTLDVTRCCHHNAALIGQRMAGAAARWDEEAGMPDDDLHIDVTDDGWLVVVTVRGEIDVLSARTLSAALEPIDDNRRVLVDMAGVQFMDSTGLASILRQSIARRAAGGSFYLRNASEPVRRLLEFCCLEHLVAPTHD